MWSLNEDKTLKAKLSKPAAEREAMILDSLNRINIKNLTIPTGSGGASSPTINKPTLLLEALASVTWERIKYSVEYHVSQGEETITDINLLEIAMSGVKEIDLWKCPKRDESRTGIDWEWLIGSPKRGWLRYAVQAKKLDPVSMRYGELGHRVGPKGKSERQIDILKRHAQRREAIPLYCLYNHVLEPDYKPYWHCSLDVDVPQLGCSVAPLRVVEEALVKKGRASKRTFRHIHSNPYTLPWRCLVRCGHVLKLYTRGDEFDDDGFGKVRVHRSLPRDISNLFQRDDISEARYDLQAEFIPKRIMVINIGDEEPREVRSEDNIEDDRLPEIRKF